MGVQPRHITPPHFDTLCIKLACYTASVDRSLFIDIPDWHPKPGVTRRYITRHPRKKRPKIHITLPPATPSESNWKIIPQTSIDGTLIRCVSCQEIGTIGEKFEVVDATD